VDRTEAGTARVNGNAVRPLALYHPTQLAEHLQTVGLDRAVVSIPPPFFGQHLSGGPTGSWTSAVNNGLLEAVADHRVLLPLAYLPFNEPDIALAELHSRASDDRFVGWVACAGGGSLALDDRELEPLWAALNGLDAFVMLHPGQTPDKRLRPHYLSNLLGNPLETTVAAAQLVFGGVLERFPSIRFLLVHCGGAVAALAGRWQRGVDTNRPGVTVAALAPRDAVRRFWVDSLCHEAAAVDLARRVIGENRMVLGSDWPFPMGLDDPWTAIEHLETEARAGIATVNARELIGR